MNEFSRFTIVLACVCVGAAVGVGGVFVLTQKPIAEKQRQTEDLLRKSVLPGATFFADLADEKGAATGVCAGYDRQGGALIGYVAKGESKGYGGRLEVMVGLAPDMTVLKAGVLLQNETPGLGAELAKVKTKDTIWDALLGKATGKGVSWMDQFSGKRPDQLELGKGLDAKSGCTITSKAIVAAARAAVKSIEDAVRTSSVAKTGDKS